MIIGCAPFDNEVKLFQAALKLAQAKCRQMFRIVGWQSSSNEAKTARYREHIEWAFQHGAIDEVDYFLRAMPLDYSQAQLLDPTANSEKSFQKPT